MEKNSQNSTSEKEDKHVPDSSHRKRMMKRRKASTIMRMKMAQLEAESARRGWSERSERKRRRTGGKRTLVLLHELIHFSLSFRELRCGVVDSVVKIFEHAAIESSISKSSSEGTKGRGARVLLDNFPPHNLCLLTEEIDGARDVGKSSILLLNEKL